MVYKSLERGSSQKTYLEMESESQIKTQNEPFGLRRFGKGMFDNDTYNLMEQLEIENRSLWRIKNSYKNDAVTIMKASDFGMPNRKRKRKNCEAFNRKSERTTITDAFHLFSNKYTSPINEQTPLS